MCSSSCRMSVIVIFLDCLINSTVPLSPDFERVLPWLIYGFPEMSSVGGEKKLKMPRSLSALWGYGLTLSRTAGLCRRVRERTLSYLWRTMSQTTTQTYGRNPQMGGVTQMVSPVEQSKQLWCNPFYIKGEKKKKTGYGSWFSLSLIMNALIVQSVANCT